MQPAGLDAVERVGPSPAPIARRAKSRRTKVQWQLLLRRRLAYKPRLPLCFSTSTDRREYSMNIRSGCKCGRSRPFPTDDFTMHWMVNAEMAEPKKLACSSDQGPCDPGQTVSLSVPASKTKTTACGERRVRQGVYSVRCDRTVQDRDKATTSQGQPQECYRGCTMAAPVAPRIGTCLKGVHIRYGWGLAEI